MKETATNPQKNKQTGDNGHSLFLEGSCEEVRQNDGQHEAKAVRIGACFKLIAAGHSEALATLYDLTATDLYGYIRSIVWCATDAEDVFQEVFTRVAARGPKLVRVEKPLAYMFTIARNEAYGLLSRKVATRQVEDGTFFDEPTSHESGTPTLTGREAGEALAQLPADQREAVVLKVYEGFTFTEIGEITESSANTVASRYRYGIMKLAKLLGRVVKED